MFNRSSIKALLDLKPIRTKEPLHTSIPLDFHCSSEVSTRPLTTRNPEPRTIFLRDSTDSSITKRSRKRQLPRVTNQPLAWWFPSATKIKTLMQCTKSSQSHKNATTKPSEWERGEGELYKGVWTFQSAKRGFPNPGMEYLYSPFLLLAVMWKTPTSRTVCDAIADCPRLNSNGKNAKSTTIRGARWAERTVRQDPADCPPGLRGLSAGRPQTVLPVHPSCTPFYMVSR
jgi:hypothetical protein